MRDEETKMKNVKHLSANSGQRYLYAVGEDVGEVSDKVHNKYGSE